MKIKSTFLPPADGEELGGLASLTAFEARIDNKSLVVGIAIGTLTGPSKDEAQVNSLAMEVVNRVIDYHQRNHAQDAPFVVVELTGTLVAVKRVREVFRHAPHRSSLMLMCANERVYEAAISVLGVDSVFGYKNT